MSALPHLTNHSPSPVFLTISCPLQVRDPETQKEEFPPQSQATGSSQAGLLGVAEKPEVRQEMKMAFAKGFGARCLHGESAS